MLTKVMNEESSGESTENQHVFDKAFKNKRFYVDLKQSALRDNVCKHILRLRGRVECFLSKEIHLLITNKKSCLLGDNAQRLSAEETEKSNSFQSNRPLSRGAALLLKAKCSKSSEHCTSSVDIIQSARKMGIKIEDVESFMQKIKKISSKIKHTKVNKIRKSSDVRDKSPLCWRDSRIILKVEDNSQHYKPLIKHMENLPSLFYVEHDASPFDGRVVLSKPNTCKKEKIKPNPYESKGGYCEMCDHWFKCRLKEHINSDQHKNFYSNQSHFDSLDSVMKGFSSLHNFLKKYTSKSDDISEITKSPEKSLKEAKHMLTPNSNMPFRDITNIKSASDVKNFKVDHDEMDVHVGNGTKLSMKQTETHNMEMSSIDNTPKNVDPLSSEQMSDDSMKTISYCQEDFSDKENNFKSSLNSPDEKTHSVRNCEQMTNSKPIFRPSYSAIAREDLPMSPVQFIKSPALKLTIRNLKTGTPSVTPNSRKSKKSRSKLLTCRKVSIRNFEDSETDEILHLIQKCSINDNCSGKDQPIMNEENEGRSSVLPEDNLFSFTDAVMQDSNTFIDNVVKQLKEDVTDPLLSNAGAILSHHKTSNYVNDGQLTSLGNNSIQSHLTAHETLLDTGKHKIRPSNECSHPVPMSIPLSEAQSRKEIKSVKKRKVRVCLFGKGEKQKDSSCPVASKDRNVDKSLYTSVKTSDTKLHIKRCKASPLKLTQSNNLKMYWRVRKTGDCRLVFCAEKRKNCDLDLPVNVHTGNEKKRQRCH